MEKALTLRSSSYFYWYLVPCKPSFHNAIWLPEDKNVGWIAAQRKLVCYHVAEAGRGIAFLLARYPHVTAEQLKYLWKLYTADGALGLGVTIVKRESDR